MPITYNIETDYLYNQGIKQGVQQGVQQGMQIGKQEEKQELAPRLFSELKLGIHEIANFLGISTQQVKEILTKKGLLK